MINLKLTPDCRNTFRGFFIMKILLYSTSKKVRRKVFTDCKITQLRRKLGINCKEERIMFNIRKDMRLLTLNNNNGI